MKVKELKPEVKRKAILKLVEMYNEAPDDKRDIIIHAICDASEGIDGAFPILKDMFGHAMKGENKNRQFIIVHALGKAGNPEAAPLLLEALKSRDGDVSNSAMVGLTKLGPKAVAVLPQLIELVKDPELQWGVLIILGKVGPLKDEKQIAVIAELMEIETGHTTMSAAVLLNKAGKPAVPALIKKLESGKVIVRRLAADVLGEIAKDDPSLAKTARPPIEAALAKEKNEVAQKTMKDVLEKMGKEEKK